MKWIRAQVKPFLKFGTVGLVAAAVDIGLFNVLNFYFQELSFRGAPIYAKIISVILSTLVAWLGNRSWTFRASRQQNHFKELFEYFVVAAGGLIIAILPLWVSHYLLGYTSVLADNISANIVGLGLATVFRYLLNKYWVFSATRSKS